MALIRIIFIFAALLSSMQIVAGNNQKFAVNLYDFDINQSENQQLDLKSAILLVIKNNTTVNKSRLDINKSILPVFNYYNTFNWNIYSYAQTYKAVLPVNKANFLSGNKLTRDQIGIGFEKTFLSGTFLNFEASTLRFDSSAFENQQTPASFRFLAVPPLYTGVVKVMISQELLKNSFGVNHENTIKILKLNSLTTADSLVLQLTGLVSETLIKYWMIEVYDSSIATFDSLLDNTSDLQRITARKIPLGIAEPFELSRWNSLVFNSKNNLATARLQRDNAERELTRILNISPRTKISGVTELKDTLPEMNLEQDIAYALETRLDLKLLKKKKEILLLNKSNIEVNSLPSLKASFEYASVGQNTASPQQNFTDPNMIPSLKYPDVKGQLNFVYPLTNLEAETDLRDSDLNLLEVDKDISDLEKQIREEMELRYNKIKSDYILYNESIQIAAEAEKFYRNLVVKYLSGKYNSELVKSALDFVAQSKMAVIQTKVTYNVSLLLYDLTKNYIFQKYGIDIHSIIKSSQTEKVQ